MLADVAAATLANLVVLAAVPFGLYYLVQRIRHGRSLGEVARRAGLQVGEVRYLLYCVPIALVVVAGLLLWSPPLEPLTREGSATHHFAGAGLGSSTFLAALLYAGVETGFSEELLFRGLIAGSLGRRLPLLQANLLQALVFFLPHLLILFVMPGAWGVLILVMAGALLMGWVRIRSDSVLGPWLLHASGNLAVALLVAARTGA